MPPTRSGTDPVPQGAAPAVMRAASVLDALSASETGFMTLSDLAREVGIPKSSTSSICTALEAAGLILREDQGYTLGRRLVELGGAYLARMDVVREFYHLCEESELFRPETLRLSALAGLDTLTLARYDGHIPTRLTSGIGDRFPASATAQGKALLAQLDDSEVERRYHGIATLPRVTTASITSVPELVAQVARARRAGFATDEQEAAEHVIGLAVAVPQRGVRTAMLAVSVTTLDADATDARRSAFVGELRRFARALGNPMAPAR